MNFLSTSSDYNPYAANGVMIVNDANKGRCYEATRDFPIGHVIFTEAALVWGSFEESADDDDDDNVDNDNEVNMDIMVKAYGSRVKNFSDNLSSILDEICRLERVQSLDTARCFLQLLALVQLNNEGQLDNHHVMSSLELLSSMTACNLDQCLNDVKNLRKAIPKLIHHTISDSEAARYLGILNTNQVELEMFGGSGLFVATSIMEHSCECNCSYTTHDNNLFMTAIKNISKGQRLSIDYGNNYYHPTYERQQQLFDTYKFQCNCSKCIGPDITRAFKCIYCKNCCFYPLGSTMDADVENFTPCVMCNQQQPVEHIAECLMHEESILTNPPSTYMQIKATTHLDESHNLLFFALHDLAMAVCSDARSSSKDSIKRFSEGLQIMTEVVRIFCNHVTGAHHEKVLFFDKLAQIALASNNYDKAKLYFQEAYDQSLMAVGKDLPLTQKLYALATNTPRTITELQQSY